MGVGVGMEWGKNEMGKRGQVYGDRWKLDFWCGEHHVVYTDVEL